MNARLKSLRLIFPTFIGWAFICIFSSNSLAQAISTKDGGAFPLFNGQDISAWNQAGNANWYPITNGVASNQGAGLLVGRFPFADFQIEFNYWIDSNTEFSIFAHCLDINYVSKDTALEVNLSDLSPRGYGPGSIVRLQRAVTIPSVHNRWNTVYISSVANQITVVVNGTTTVNKLNYQQFNSGPLAIRFGGGNLKITNFTATIPGRW